MDNKIRFGVSMFVLVLLVSASVSAFNLWDWLTGRSNVQEEMSPEIRTETNTNVRQVVDRSPSASEINDLQEDNTDAEPLILDKELSDDLYENFDVVEEETIEITSEDDMHPDPEDYPGEESYVEYFGTLEYQDIAGISYVMDSTVSNRYAIYLNLFMQDKNIRYYPKYSDHEIGKLSRLELTFNNYEQALAMYNLIKDTYSQSKSASSDFMAFRINFKSTECINKKYIEKDMSGYDTDYEDYPQFFMSRCIVPFDNKGEGSFELKTISYYAYKMYS